MRNTILKGVFLFFLFIFSFLAFLPKENLYFYALEKLDTSGVSVENEVFTSNFFGFTLLSSDIFYKEMNLLHLEESTVSSFLFYSKVEAINGKIDGLILEKIKFSWSILHPLTVDILVDSQDLKAIGNYNLMTKQVTLLITPTSEVAIKYKYLLEQCEKTQAGEYKLEYNL